MSDPSFAEFNSRIARIEKARSKGYGFEASGTLGRSFYTRHARRMRMDIPLLRPVMALLICGTILKALFLTHLGTQAYEDRVARLMEGQGFDRIGGFLMTADPVTEQVASRISYLVETYG